MNYFQKKIIIKDHLVKIRTTTNVCHQGRWVNQSTGWWLPPGEGALWDLAKEKQEAGGEEDLGMLKGREQLV